MANPLQLDHIIILVPSALLTTPPPWLTDNFTLTTGGRHGDNKTENKLIIFADRSYIELIAFIDDLPANRAGHFWDKPFGIVDFALTSGAGAGVGDAGEADAAREAVMARLAGSADDVEAAFGGNGLVYYEPKRGSRVRADTGQELAWKVTGPSGCHRGEVVGYGSFHPQKAT